jgi:hypothetical protein
MPTPTIFKSLLLCKLEEKRGNRVAFLEDLESETLSPNTDAKWQLQLLLAAKNMVPLDAKSYYQSGVHLHLDLGKPILNNGCILGDNHMDGVRGI